MQLLTCILLITVLLTACVAPSPTTCPSCESVEITVVHTQIVQERVTVEVTVPVKVTEIVEVEVEVQVPVTVTPTPTPQNSPTPTLTPTITPTPTETPTPTPTPLPTNTPNLALTGTAEAMGDLVAPKGDGFYLIGVDIAPGKWESTGSGSGCYWARRNKDQDTIDNHFGLAGGTVTLLATDYEVEFDGCGRWIYVENREKVLANDAMESKGDGFYTVGIEIAPGRWRSTGSGDDCYWARLDGWQDTLDNHFGNAGGSVTIRATDYEVRFEDCGMWEYLGP